jgi:predicted O-methyltransferase YrrM
VRTACDSRLRVLDALAGVFGDKVRQAPKAFTRAGMSIEELVRLHELVGRSGVGRVLEIGFARGTSSLAILDALRDVAGGHLTSVDPNQSLPEPEGYAGAGLANVRRAGFVDRHQLVERPDYVALPQLVERQASFDLVLIDGWHSFDYTFVDTFYADLLLPDGGLLVFHDSSWPGVYKSIRFLETHKPYKRITPAPWLRHRSPLLRAVKRAWEICRNPSARHAARQRNDHWLTLAAYRKQTSQMVQEERALGELYADF